MSERALETKVGSFLLLGLLIMATMIIIFGRFEESFKPTYTITVKFANAEGLVKGTTVTLAGSPIGRIKNYPHPVVDDGETKIAVDLRIDKQYEIHKDAKFRIVSIGMLGDKGIDVQPRRIGKGEAGAGILENGDEVEGASSGGGIEDLTEGARPAMDEIREAAEGIKNLSGRLNSDVMTPETVADVQESIKKLRSVLTRVDALLAQAQEGKGPLARVLNDPKMADDLTSFIYNLRHKGILFYGDLASEENAAAKDKEKGKAK